ncbi:EAL domain-containing protein [Neobacillus cucumis]|nr:EAL domain-containing protein [Neobacillus cucumis]
MKHRILSNKRIAASLKRALSRKEFFLMYQPKLDLVSGKIIGVEALIRWMHPKKGVIQPSEFISTIEKTGLIIPIGEWIIHTACRQNKAWQKAGYNPVLMSINLSASQLYQPNFADRVRHILKLTGLAPEFLIFEITERIMLDPYRALKVIRELKQIGAQISLDDFGTGYNTLQHLRELPIDKIKIDRSFIKNSTLESYKATIVKMIIEMAHRLNMDVVAEGIETKDQLVFLQQNLCNQGQGFLFSKPLSPEELEKDFNRIEQIVIREGIPQDVFNLEKQRQLERDLRKSESNYRLITENIQDVVVKLDKTGNVLYASPSHEKVFGIPANEYEGYHSFDLVHPEDIPSLQLQYASMIGNKTPCQVEFRHQHTNGSWIPIEAKITPVYHEDENIEYFIAVGRDISVRRQTEELIRKAEKLSTVGHLASSVAHEIRNPLTTIKGFAQLLQKEVDKPLYTKTILSEIDQLEAIVQEFINFAKPQTHHLKETDIYSLLQQVLLFFKSQVNLNNIEILPECDTDLPRIYCDESQIKQVFFHILQNAVEAMPNGGTIRVQMVCQGIDSIKITFIDQGKGISEERIRRIGEPYYNTKEKGTGMGLMTCQKTLKEHGGKFNIKSIMNHGTTVDIILPISGICPTG